MKFEHKTTKLKEINSKDGVIFSAPEPTGDGWKLITVQNNCAYWEREIEEKKWPFKQ